jgi:hypothetical protein
LDIGAERFPGDAVHRALLRLALSTILLAQTIVGCVFLI